MWTHDNNFNLTDLNEQKNIAVFVWNFPVIVSQMKYEDTCPANNKQVYIISGISHNQSR